MTSPGSDPYNVSPGSPGPQFTPPPPGFDPNHGEPVRNEKTNTLAVVSLVASILGLFCGIGFIVGLICGILGLRQINTTGQRGRNLAIAGIVISAIFLILYICAGIYFGTQAGTTNSL